MLTNENPIPVLLLANKVILEVLACASDAIHYDFTTDKVCHSLKFITQPVVIEPKPFDFGYKS